MAILLAPFSDPAVLQASNFIQLDSEFPNNFRLRTSLRKSSFTRISSVRGQTKPQHVHRPQRLILCHEGCLLIRKNPSILLRMLFILFILFIFNGEYDNVAEYEKLTSEAKI
jgi:hypothetical protein